jgi:hypothetical protein
MVIDEAFFADAFHAATLAGTFRADESRILAGGIAEPFPIDAAAGGQAIAACGDLARDGVITTASPGFAFALWRRAAVKRINKGKRPKQGSIM